jgi:hypothetical protein
LTCSCLTGTPNSLEGRKLSTCGGTLFLHHHHHSIPPRWNNWIVDVLSHCRLSPSVCTLYIWLFRLSLSHSSGGFKWKVRNKKPPKKLDLWRLYWPDDPTFLIRVVRFPANFHGTHTVTHTATADR